MARAGWREIAPWLGLAALVFALDVVTKWLILLNFQLGDSVTVTSFFNLVRVHNPGAAFSFLAGAGGWQRWFFTAIGVGASVFIVWMLRAHPGQKLFAFALASIMGGALGNVVDRLVHGHVIDWLDFHWRFLEGLFPGGHFPSFNLADTFISLGAACLILDEVLRMRRARRAA
ncbi:MAG: lipoprotein signal peptidase [Hydrogenophaga sp.]|uniref:Lipoprotein signal peptidase n=1 Tax=Hydrogenophaga crocea TaxID=2716225 RepID=A0A6G8IIB2_9BURK|nr:MULTISPECIES: signal peptidase II [Hydrogenophaga]MBL0944226.1 lipoprotein signal peptidase [Hydrogenophaga sp.]QIM52775.1 lipoprotein signal peptidase [Hydrogenophaga crocea]